MNPLLNRPKRDLRSDTGYAILDLVIIAPFIIFTAITAFNFDHTISNQHTMSLVSREAANAAYRNCAKWVLDPEVQPETADDPADLCLQDVVNDLKVQINPVLPGIDISASLYRCDSHSCIGPCIPGKRCQCRCASSRNARVGFGTTDPYGSSSTQHTPKLVGRRYREILNRKGYVFVSEVFYQEPTFAGRSLYEQTVY